MDDQQVRQYRGLGWHSQDGKTILEGINIVVVDSASANPIQAKKPQRVDAAGRVRRVCLQQHRIPKEFWEQRPMASSPPDPAKRSVTPISSLQQPWQGLRPVPESGWSRLPVDSFTEQGEPRPEKLQPRLRLFQVARADLVAGMLGAGAQDLGTIFMDNVYNVGDFSTGDANGYATVLGINTVLKTAKAPRGATKAKN